MKSSYPLRAALAAVALLLVSSGAQSHDAVADPGNITTPAPASTTLAALAADLRVGDIVFTRIPYAPFTRITEVTGGWANHVGVVVDVAGAEPQIAESKVPLSRITPLSSFVRRSDHGRVAVMRLPEPLTAAQQDRLLRAVDQRLGKLYDTGFDIESPRQFCSRFVREVLAEATGAEYGELQRLADLLAANPGADQRFWKLWYFGRIPWQRTTLTPESLRRDARLQTLFDGHALSRPL